MLKEGPKNIDEIKDELDVSASALMPQIKKLLKWDLLIYDSDEDIYMLSDMGSLLIEKIADFLNIADIYVENRKYWKIRDLSEIPSHIRKSMGNLVHSELLEANRDCLFEFPPTFVQNVLDSKYVMMVSSTFQPQTVNIFSKLLRNNSKVSWVFTAQILDKYLEDFPDQFNNFLTHENMDIYVSSGHIGPLAMVVTDRFMGMWLFDKNRRFDGTTLINYEESALNWGRELFTYYSQISNRVYIDPETRKMKITGMTSKNQKDSDPDLCRFSLF
ncbi:hypothetical protein MSMTP_0579 [Methanosarcina sp. MTP4]|uniref:helix-turn-helix transcriptional regulator n=1 Tax=Methanosarcina sp. MTP4 TaxID=1434100 RepID=UPI0006154BB8|nr:winged helix-turn-helix domain-containing protein [Methanosarcina sp. MTP4]AKB24048.1 hypothetical protein MSMTP_0579 [Methanosarcina sp. MTP4]